MFTARVADDAPEGQVDHRTCELRQSLGGDFSGRSEATFGVGLGGVDGAPQIVGTVASEARAGQTDDGQRVRVGPAEAGQPVLIDETNGSGL